MKYDNKAVLDSFLDILWPDGLLRGVFVLLDILPRYHRAYTRHIEPREEAH